MKTILTILFSIALTCFGLGSPSNEALMTGTNTQEIIGQKIFHSTGTQDSPLIAWSQSGASAGLFQQDTHFNSPALVVQRTGTAGGELATSPILLVQAGREQQWDMPVFRAWGCLALSGDNGFVTYGDGSICATSGILLDRERISGGAISVNTKDRQLVRADGSHLDWGTTDQPTSLLTVGTADGRYLSIHTTIPTNTNQLTNGAGFITRSTADGRYAPIGSTGGGGGGSSTIVLQVKGVMWSNYQSISSDAITTLQFPTVVTDSKGGWNATSNTYTIQENGNYLLCANCSVFNVAGSNWRILLNFFINGGYRDISGQVGNYNTNYDQGPSLNGTQVAQLNAGDTIAVVICANGTSGKAEGHVFTIIKL